MKDHVLFMLVVMLALPSHADENSDAYHSQPGDLTTLTDYLSFALDHNPGLKAMASRVDAANNRIPQARALPDPMIQVTRFVDSVQTRTGPQETVFMLSQRFPWFGTLSGREDAAAADALGLNFAFWNKQLTLVRIASEMFFEYGYTGKAIELTRENLELLLNLEPIVESRVQGGGDLNELLRLKVETGMLNDKLASLNRKRLVQSAQLNAVLGISGDEIRDWPDWSPPEPFEFDAASLNRALQEQNPELSRLSQSVVSSKARSKVASAASYPDFVLGVNYIQTGDPVVNPDTPNAGEDPWSITAAISLPLWGGKSRGLRREALANEKAAEEDMQNRANELQASLRSSLALYEDANRRIDLYGQELLALAKQAVENSRTSYEGGRTGILELIDSERSLLDLQLIYWRAAADAWKERIAIQTLVEADPQSILNQSQRETTP